MAGLAEKLGFVVTPSLNGTFGVRRKFTAARTPEMLLLGLALGKNLAYPGQGNDNYDDNAEDSFRRHVIP